MDFKGKVGIVTGGAQGIGKAICKAFLNAGMKVLVCDIDDSTAKAFLEELPEKIKSNIAYQKCDVTSFDDFRAAFEKAKSLFGRIDVLMNNAGIMNEKQWKKTIEVNLIGVIHGIQLAFEYMGRIYGGSGGAIVNTSSCAGMSFYDLAPVYTATKHGVIGLTRSYGQDYHYEKTGVTIHSICPGPTDTPLYDIFPSRTVDEKLSSKYRDSFKDISPAEEVANGVLKILRDGKNGSVLSTDYVRGAFYEEFEKSPLER